MKNRPSHQRSYIRIENFFLLCPALIPLLVLANFYRTNAETVGFLQLGTVFAFTLLASLLITLVIWGLVKELNKSVLLASVSIFLFVVYGSVYRLFKSTLHLTIRHRFLLPVFILLILLSAVLILKGKEKQGQRKALVILSIVLAGLNLYNLVCGWIIQTRVNKAVNTSEQTEVAIQTGKNFIKPDIYYLVFDEMADPEIVTQYFDVDEEIVQINQALADVGFQQYSGIRSSYTATQVEMAGRLNMRTYDRSSELIKDRSYMIREIDNAKVFAIFKQYGYKTAIFPGYYYLLNNSLELPEINVDLVISYNADDADLERQYVASVVVPMLLHYTMLDPVVEKLPAIKLGSGKTSDYATNYRNLVLFGLNETPKIREQIEGPFFYYAHFPTPHVPYVFDEKGNQPEGTCNNHALCYGQQYVYVANEMIEIVQAILVQYPADRQPIIIIQSDHGFRNSADEAWIPFSDYPRENAYRIFFAVYASPQTLLQPIETNFNPVNTFPWILNSLFEADIPTVFE